MSTMQDRMKIAPPAGGGIGVIACRSTSTSSNNKHKNSTPVSQQQQLQRPTATETPVHQPISDFEDSAEDGARKKTAAAALEKNVLNRCHHLAENEGSRKKMACSSKQSNNFLHDNDFTFIDADDDLQSITGTGEEELDTALENVTGDNGCDCTDNACSSETNIYGSHISTATAADHDPDGALGKSIRSTSQQCKPPKPQQQTQNHKQQLQPQGLPPQQQTPHQQQAAKQLPERQTSTWRDHQPRPGAQSGTTTLKIKRLLVLPAEDYASANSRSVSASSVIDRQQCVDVNNDRGVVGNMVQLPEDQLKSDSSRCGGSVIGPEEANVQDRSAVKDDHSGGNNDEEPCVIDEARRNLGIRSGSEVITVGTMKQQPQVNKDINHGRDIDRSFAAVDGQQEEDEDDPYAELDMYLEKVKSEINEVFEKFNMPPPETTTTSADFTSSISSNGLDRITGTTTASNNARSYRSSSEPVAPRSLSALGGDNNLLPAPVETQEKEKVELRGSQETTTAVIMDNDSSGRLSILPYPRGSDCREDLVADWANSVMKECDELAIDVIDSRPSSLLVASSTTAANGTVLPEEWAPTREATLRRGSGAGGHSYADHDVERHSMTLMATRTPLSGAGAAVENSDASPGDFRRTAAGPKPDKLMESKQRQHHPHRQHKVGDETVLLKINEDDLCDEVLAEAAAVTSIQHTKKDSISTDWTSEESMLRGVDNLDEDNKSTSSSACDVVASPALSSGKSGNSLDSSELDNEHTTESGIGRLTPLGPLSGKSLLRGACSRKYHRGLLSDAANEDPDLLEVLSLCDDNNEGNELDLMLDMEQYENQSKNGRLMDVSFGTDSSSSKLSTDHDEDSGVVVLRHKDRFGYAASPYNDRSAFSLPHGSGYRTIHKFSASPKDSSDNNNNNSSNKQECQQCSQTLPFQKRSKSATKELDTPKRSEAVKSRPFCLPIQDSYQNMVDLPSPSSASLHSGRMHHKYDSNFLQDMAAKSSSAPLLMKKDKAREHFTEKTTLRYSRSQSDRYLAEIEAIEACKWLRAAGFPQYAQMYEDLQFPIDLSNVAKDHPFLENDPLQSLYRRLVALNRCATMRLDNAHHSKHQAQQREREDSDDDSCALSENWTFEPQGRRWSRVGENMGLPLPPPSPGATSSSKQDATRSDISSRESSPESMEGYGSLPSGASKFRRTGSERLKDGAKAFLRRVESIKTRRKKRQHRDGLVISGPVLDFGQMNQKMTDLKCVDVGSYPNSPLPPNTPAKGQDLLKVPPAFVTFDEHQNRSSNRLSPKNFYAMGKVYGSGTQSHRTSPLHFSFGKSGDDSSSYYSDSQDSGTVQTSSSGGSMRKKSTRTRKFFQRSKADDGGALSDSECNQRKLEATEEPVGNELKVPMFTRGGSLNLGRDSNKYRDKLKNRSLRSRSLRKSDKYADSDKEEDVVLRVNKNTVVRWHSFQTAAEKAANRTSGKRSGMPLMTMSCGQLQVIRKLGLVTLTGCMERYCPTHRSGWNWELPKFIKKIKMPDYKDKRVFGVPLVITLQRSGQALPKTIEAAMNWLKVNALDQIGLFRKSGVKSRIAKVKAIVEMSPDCDSLELFEGQQPYDVADMIKQYFRDLPESLFTNKLAETFIAIFQHLPEEVRQDAIQSAIMLLPDENREVLYMLLQFLTQVADNAMFNQMTINNLAVCLAPSIFHVGMSSPSRSTSVSPRRRKATGIPDARELSETKASHECLAFMIGNIRSLFTVPHEKITRCNFSYMEESKPVPLSELGKGMDLQDWRAYLDQCTSAIMKEGKERPRGWISAASVDPSVEVFYKKVGDGHPLRLWKTCVEVEAPPADVCQYIINERHLWDPFFVDSRVVEQLDEKSEIFQYVCGGQMLSDYCVLRSCRTNLPKGACVIVETSVDHGSAQLLGSHANSVRGVVLASRYLIEPCGGGKSKIMHLARVDTKGRTPEWYNKCYGHICSQYLSRIRNGLKHVANGPESKV